MWESVDTLIPRGISPRLLVGELGIGHVEWSGWTWLGMSDVWQGRQGLLLQALVYSVYHLLGIG